MPTPPPAAPRAVPAHPAKDHFATCLEAVFADDPVLANWSRDAGGPVGEGLLSVLQGGPVGKEAARDLSAERRSALLRRLYWAPTRAGLLPAGAGRALLALAMRIGPHRAVLAAQRALGIEQDGVLDAERLSPLSPASVRALEAALDRAWRDAG